MIGLADSVVGLEVSTLRRCAIAKLDFTEHILWKAGPDIFGHVQRRRALLFIILSITAQRKSFTTSSQEVTYHFDFSHVMFLFCGRGIVPITAGGDHSISYPILRAVAEAAGGPVGLVHLDAHHDTVDLQESEDSTGSKVRR